MSEVENGVIIDHGPDASFTQREIKYEVPEGVIRLVEDIKGAVSIAYKFDSRSGSICIPDPEKIKTHERLKELEGILKKTYNVTLLAVLNQLQGESYKPDSFTQLLQERAEKEGVPFDKSNGRVLEALLPN